MWSRDDDLEGADKYRACVPYLLPLLDGEKFGKYIYESVPPLGFLDSLFIGPLHETYAQFDWLGLLLFCALTLTPAFSSNSTMSLCPFKLAVISGVVPILLAIDASALELRRVEITLECPF